MNAEDVVVTGRKWLNARLTRYLCLAMQRDTTGTAPGNTVYLFASSDCNHFPVRALYIRGRGFTDKNKFTHDRKNV